MQIIMYYNSGVSAYNHNTLLVTKEPHPIYLGLCFKMSFRVCKSLQLSGHQMLLWSNVMPTLAIG